MVYLYIVSSYHNLFEGWLIILERLKGYNFFNIILLLILLSTFQLYFYSFYTDIDLSTFFSFHSSDKWCVNGQKIIGVHCFGDLGLNVIQISETNNIWARGYASSPAPYPPLNYIGFKILYLIGSKFGVSLMTLLYSLFNMSIVWFTIYFALRKFSLSQKVIASTALTFTSLPMVIILDRGNNFVWIFPFLYMFSLSFLKNKYFYSLFFLTIMVSLRPQFILLGILYIFVGKVRLLLLTPLLSALSIFISFLIWDSSRVTLNITEWINNILQHSTYVSIDPVWPYNYAVGKGFYSLTKFVREMTNYDFTDYFTFTSSFLFLLLIINFSLIRNKKKDFNLRLLLSFVPLILFSAPIVWHYYSLGTIVLLILIINSDIDLFDLGNENKFIGLIYFITLTLSLTSISIPFAAASAPNNYVNLVQVLIPVMWFLLLVLLIIQQMITIVRNYLFSHSQKKITKSIPFKNSNFE